MNDESNPTTLYVGNLNHSVSEELLWALFSQIGQINGCKVIREPGYDPYAFVDFTTHQAAATALVAMNKRFFLEKEMKVNWATSSGNQPKLDTSNHHHIFVGDLSPEIETQTLKDAFAPFGEISNCRIVRDPQTLKSKGYAFVSFLKKVDAENAILAMNGQWLGNRSIRTNWSTRKPPPPRDVRGKQNNAKAPTFDEVYNQSSPTNCTVYCGGFTVNGISDEIMQKVFSQFGTILDIRCFRDKGYAFIKFTNKEAAAHAIESVHNTEMNGQVVKCFWGKESVDINATNLNNNVNMSTQMIGAATPQWPYMYGNIGYWYPQSYAGPSAQYYTGYGQFTDTGYPVNNQNYIGRMGNMSSGTTAADANANRNINTAATSIDGNITATASTSTTMANWCPGFPSATNSSLIGGSNDSSSEQQSPASAQVQMQGNVMTAYTVKQYNSQ